jgi:hypothetical protein
MQGKKYLTCRGVQHMEVHHNDMPESLLEEKNRFERWMESLNCICDTNYARISLLIGVSKSALSQGIRRGSVKPETALAIMEMYRMLAERQNVFLPITWEKFFLLSWFKEGGDIIREADAALLNMEFLAGMVRERNELRRQVQTLKSQSLGQDLLTSLRENKRLRGELERYKREGNS